MGGRETTPPPLPRSRRGEGGHTRGGRGGGRETPSSARPGDPAARRGENNFQPAASASPAPVSGASIAPSDHQREILEEYALQTYMRIVFPRVSLRRKGRERDFSSGVCSAGSTTKPPCSGTSTQVLDPGMKSDFTALVFGESFNCILLMLSRVTIVGIFYHLEFLCLADLNSNLPVYGK